MKLIVCIDNSNGMMFNNRRVSKDSEVVKDILNITKDSKLYCSKYSSSLFSECLDISECLDDGYYFMEDIDVSDISYNYVIVYKWNRDYPADSYFTYDLSNYNLIDTYEFKGSSHNLITRLVYEKVDMEGNEEVKE